MNIRPLSDDDRPAIVDIYNHYIENTAITFDLAPYTVAGRSAWFEQFDGHRWRCLVAEDAGKVIGYANSARFRTKAAYETSVEVSVYLHPEHTGRGTGRALYETLFETLADTNVHRAYAGVTLPNEPSLKLHTALRFEPCGTFKEVGFKFDRYWDVAWLEKDCSRAAPGSGGSEASLKKANIGAEGA